jgi:chemotaxis response regulator CheB
MQIEVAIFKDNKLIRHALEAILNGTGGYTCCGTFPDDSRWEEKIKGLHQM